MKSREKKKSTREFTLYDFIKGILRRAFRKFPFYAKTLNAAKEEYFIPSKEGKPMRRVHYRCAHCKQFFNSKDVCVDHIDPVISTISGRTDYNDLVSRMFTDKLQVLCNYKGIRAGKRSCHYDKTQAEKIELLESKKSLQKK